MHALQRPSHAHTERSRAFPVIKRLVVPLDGTPYAEQAIPAAVALARTLNAEVVLVRANPAAPTDDGARARLVQRRTRETRHSASLYLARQEHELRARGVRVSSCLPLGPAAEAIAATATERAADLIVIATHLGTTFSRPSQVSVAHELLCSAEVPVLLLSSATRTPFDRMDGLGLTLLVPLGGSSGGVSASALPYAAALAKALSGQLLLLRAVGGPAAQALRRDDPALFAVATAPLRDKAIGSLERLRDQLMQQDIPVWTGIVYGDLLQETARQAHAGSELIVLGVVDTSSGRREAPLHSALTLLHRAGVPLLIVPPMESPRQRLTPVSASDVAADPSLAEEVFS
jgi:nucleotide-binding universal stress UspA family protein